MISCRYATELISRRLDTELPLPQRAVLGWHTLVCGSCRRYGRQLSVLESAVADYLASANGSGVSASLPAAAREQLQALIEEKLNGEL